MKTPEKLAELCGFDICSCEPSVEMGGCEFCRVTDAIRSAITEARAEEREACATVLDVIAAAHDEEADHYANNHIVNGRRYRADGSARVCRDKADVAREHAAAIRARGGKT